MIVNFQSETPVRRPEQSFPDQSHSFSQWPGTPALLLCGAHQHIKGWFASKNRAEGKRSSCRESLKKTKTQYSNSHMQTHAGILPEFRLFSQEKHVGPVGGARLRKFLAIHQGQVRERRPWDAR